MIRRFLSRMVGAAVCLASFGAAGAALAQIQSSSPGYHAPLIQSPPAFNGGQFTPQQREQPLLQPALPNPSFPIQRRVLHAPAARQ